MTVAWTIDPSTLVLSSGLFGPMQAHVFQRYVQQARAGNVSGQTWVAPDILIQRQPSLPEIQ